MPATDDARERPDLSVGRRVHLVGAGGSGMSSIAIVLATMGHRVSGTDASDSPVLARLVEVGVDARAGHHPALVAGADIVSASTAVPADDPELVEARRLGIRVWTRAQLFGAICALRRTVAIAGTHGKTTTSAMLVAAMEDLKPSFVIGGQVAGRGSGARWVATSEWFVAEADESDGTFLELGAEAAVVTSVEPDHLEFWGGEEALRAAFDSFVHQVPGPVVLGADDPGAASLVGQSKTALTYGTSPSAGARIVSLEAGASDSSFHIESEGSSFGPFRVAVPGLYNARNAAAALCMAHLLGVSWEAAGAGLAAYRGVARRFELRGERAGVTFIDDYGHLPGEVAPVLATARAGGWKRVVAIFQPHRYSRTADLWQDFADSFVVADIVVITDVYPAGEEPRAGVSGRLVVDAIRRAHPEADVRYAPGVDDVEQLLVGVLRPGDLCLTLGAGDLTKLPDRMLALMAAGGG